MTAGGDILHHLVAGSLGGERASLVLGLLAIDPALAEDDSLTRAQIAMALNVLLFADLLDRVPTAARYVGEARAAGRRICFDHGALRTIDGPTGALPPGHAAFARILEPLGYRMAGIYPLPRLTMTGHAFAHADLPETVPQFFVSEFHVAGLPLPAQVAAERVFGASRDPLDGTALTLLASLARDGRCSPGLAVAGLPALVRAFGRQHPTPRLDDYQALLAFSAEAAWIASEGNAFNHATDRVDDVDALAAELAARGYPLKPAVEHSASKRVRQTAFLADPVRRDFVCNNGAVRTLTVPGSFYEFISRDRDPATGRLDLAFDSGNATGIFAVTQRR